MNNFHANEIEKNNPRFKALFQEMVVIYKEMKRLPEPNSEIQYTREWEYPFAIIKGEIEDGLTVLDLGGGASPLPLWLARKKCIVEVIDIDTDDNRPPNRDMLWGYHPQYTETNLTYIKGDFTKYNFEKTYDRIFCIGVLEHLKTQEERDYVTELIPELLNYNGIAIITWDIPKVFSNEFLNYHSDVEATVIRKV